jgi:muconolactone delta-isomerase
MLYLITCKLLRPISSEAYQAFISQRDYCVDQEKKGKVKFFGTFADFSGSIAILDAASHEEAQQIFAKSPIFRFVTAEMDPLIDMNAYVKIFKELLAGK